MMLYIALALILVGILCFIYVSFQPNSKTESGSSGFSRGNSVPSSKEKKVSQDALASMKKGGRSEMYAQMDQAFAEERKIRPYSQRQKEETFSREPEAFETVSQEEIVTRPLEEERKPEIREIHTKQEETHASPKEEEWSMEGILFLDLSGRLPYESLKEKLRPESLKGFRRMGKGIIREIPGGFRFQASNSEFSYKLSEVEKIIFYDEGFALLPLKREYPTPVFLTKDSEKFKSYLEYTAGT
ncbi:hypothetical protein EHQ53_18195 [Leptospira langatensis]|uniref:Uncharacterized protein n=1 Tax=Leptospira langatensis TaxID=2484983 RepID=A0A5F1ZRM2_9LEPT|nr:hypothetical protein [Leptospira langatensis]TGK05550.1 hypothetical protein EHO57_02435 [Leptospira langatensis]TGL38682.1 hypothetical protein EHQ53_18195 [Leptospira langatensis]